MFGEIKNPQGERLDYAFHEVHNNSKNIVVLGHGVTGNKDRPLLVALAQGLSRAGIAALRFSFSGNGESGGRFEESTVTKEVEDLGAVLDALEGWNVCYGGHSMGAAVGVLRAARDPRIKSLVSLAGMVHTEAFAAREFGNVPPGKGFMWDEPRCPLSQAYMDDMSRVKSVIEHVPKIRVPWLFIHGAEDDVVPMQDSHEAFAAAHEPKKLIEIERANHVFAGEFTELMADRVVDWVTNQFGR